MSKASIIGAYNTPFGAFVKKDKATGLVTDELSGAPLPGVRVAVFGGVEWWPAGSPVSIRAEMRRISHESFTLGAGMAF